MKKNNNSLLVTILGGVLFCFTFLGMAFIFTNNTRIMRGNTSINNPFINGEGINLGDENNCTCQAYNYTCDSGYLMNNRCYDSCQVLADPSICSSDGGTEVSGHGCCYSSTEATRTSCKTCSEGCHPQGNTCEADENNEPPCDPGYYVDSSNHCHSAPYGYTCPGGNGGSNTCYIDVPAGKKLPLALSSFTEACDAGTYASSTRTVYYGGTIGCEPCDGVVVADGTVCAPAGNISGCVHYEYSNSGVASCTQCVAGLTPSSNGTQCIIGANCMSECIASGNGTSYCATYRCNSQNSGLQSCGNYQTYDDDSESCVCINNNYKPLTTGTGCVLKECSEFSTSDCPSSRCHVDGTSCVDTEKELGSVVGGGSAYVTPDTCKTFLIQAKDTDGENIASTWSISGSHYTASCTGSSSMCSVKVCGWGCNGGTTVKVTAHHGSVDKTANITVHSYAKWSSTEWGTTPAGNEQAYSYDGNYDGNASNYDGSSLNENVCYGYSGASRDPETGDIVYEKRWNRCCGSTAKCYIDDDNVYHWTKSPESSWKVVSKTQSECTNADACFETPTGERVWGKHYEQISQGYILITSIKDSDVCLNSSPDDACYVNDNDETDYVWSSTAPDGYTKADDIDDAKDCQPAICYLNITTNEYTIGQYENDGNYAKVYDENDKLITDIERCKPSACYKKKSTGDYLWGYYGGSPDYELIAGINDAAECTGEVVVPPTGISLSKVIYICMAVLMACGVGFIYYSSVVKKNN